MNKDIDSKNSLEQNVFQNDLDFKVFQDILGTLDGIQAIFVSRKKWSSQKGNFLKKNENRNSQKQYTLYLPKNLKVNELPSIIYKINKITFWEEIPIYASGNELKIQIVFAIDSLCKTLNNRNITPKIIKKAIKNYIRLYAQIFWDKEAQQLNNIDYRKGILDNRNIDKFKSYEKSIVKIQTQEKIEELEICLENIVAQELRIHFPESFLERWINKIRLWLMTITQTEQMKLNTEQEGVSTHVSIENLDKKERLLRKKIGIDKLKKKLKTVRENWTKEEIEQEELNATNAIIHTIHEYPYQKTKENYWYQPKYILETKEIYCVWFSLLWHAFLSELWIKHKELSIPEHSALEVIIWNKSYYFDATWSDKLFEIKRWKKIWNYTEILPIKWKFNETIFAISGDPERNLLYNLYNNKGTYYCKKKKYKKAIYFYNKSIKINSDDYMAYYNKWKALYEQKKYKEAIMMYNEALKKYPLDVNCYNNKWLALSYIWKSKEALIIFDEWLKLNPKDLDLNFNKGNILLSLNKPDKALMSYNKALETEADYRKALNNKWNALYNLGKYKESFEIYQKTIQIYNKFSWTFYNAGKCLFHIKQYQKAIIYYKKTLDIDPKNRRPYQEIWEAYKVLGQSKKESLYMYVADLLHWKKYIKKRGLDREKIEKITNFVKTEKLDLLKSYIFDLEKKL